MRRNTFIIGCSALALALAAGTPATAQDADRPNTDRSRAARTLAPEKAAVARTWLARDAARELGLDAEQTGKLVQAYLASRKQRDEYSRALGAAAGRIRARARRRAGSGPGPGTFRSPRCRSGPGPGGSWTRRERRPRRRAGANRGDRQRGRRGGRFGRVDPEMVARHRKDLETSIAAFLAPEQARKATTMLFPSTLRADRMVDVIVGFGLDEPKTFDAVAAIRKHGMALAKGMEEARASGDRQAMRDVMLDARDDLQDALDAILGPEQMEEFEDATMRRRGRRDREPIF